MIYDIDMAAVKDGFAATGAPLIVKGKVIVGVGGGEFANRGFIDAYDPMTGQRAWRFWTGAQIFVPPTNYLLDGRQHVVIPSGTTMTAFSLPASPGR